MTDILSFTSIADAMLKGRQAVKGSFNLKAGMDDNTTTNEEKNYIQMFNVNWSAKSQPLEARFPSSWLPAIKLRGCLTMSSKLILY